MTDNKPAPSKRVLVVDDDESLRRLTSMILAKAGYTTVQAENGAAAAVILRQESFDAVLADLQMPVMDGLLLLRWIRGEAHLATPVVVFTSSDSDDRGLQDEIRTAGANAVLFKPVDRAVLLETLKRLI